MSEATNTVNSYILLQLAIHVLSTVYREKSLIDDNHVRIITSYKLICRRVLVLDLDVCRRVLGLDLDVCRRVLGSDVDVHMEKTMKALKA